MKNSESNLRILPFLKWCPVFFALSLAILLITLWRAPVSVPYLTACAGFGLFSWLLISLGYSKNHLNLALTLCTVFVPAGLVVRYLSFSPHDENASSWSVLSQYGAVVLTVIFGLTWALRHRINESVPKRDAE